MNSEYQGSKTQHITKHIFVIGGVVSSIGKGLTASSLGRLLRMRGLRVLQQKLDPYINVDPGTMNPFQHGEVFVTDDGGETDLDIGHYERFLGVPLTHEANVTTGQIYENVLRKERAGEYLGECVQVIPHITNEIKLRMRAQVADDVDIIITEIGGTVGDIESLPFMEAARQVARELGSENCLFILLSLIPYIRSAHEMKTKPTQHAVMASRQLGIQPNAIVLRSEKPIDESVREKVALMCNVDEKGVINCPDASSIYEVPQILHSEKLDDFVIDSLHLTAHKVEWGEWGDLLERVKNPQGTVRIAIVGKYIELPDAYLSVVEALKAAGFAAHYDVDIKWVEADTCTNMETTEEQLGDCGGILVPGGFGSRGIPGMLMALRWARENKVPTLGICLGLQCMVIEYARDVLNLPDANSTEFDSSTQHPVIATMEEQKEIVAGLGDMGHTMRLGSYPAVLKSNSYVARLYGSTTTEERHRHRYEVNVEYHKPLEDAGLMISGTSPDGQLAEFVELPQDVHPFYMATQGHPEFKSRPYAPRPLFIGLINAAIDRQKEIDKNTRQWDKEERK